ncbi:MAG: ComF family protein [Bacteroidales bacterium]|nr:ComF family protein [Bacteroidales bacterium]
MKAKITPFLNNLISIFYPNTCIACGIVLRQNEHHLCTHCLAHLPETDYHLQKDNPLKMMFLGRAKVENVTALLFFKKGNQVQQILHSLKYKGDYEIGEFLGQYYGHKLIQTTDYQSIDLILPIPLHKKKLKLRGYNQSEAIAKGLSSAMNIPYSTTHLIRTEYTETQTHKSRFNRWENVKEVFAVDHRDEIRGKHLLICDDVLTTGATTEAAIQQLLTIPDVKVSVATLACAN